MIRYLLLCLFFAGSTMATMAQDNNVMAKAAYQNAEEAFAAGNMTEAAEELARVDQLLGKLTPKSQYLRVLIWNASVENNPANTARAIEQCKKYLAMAKSFELPEDKELEVARLLQKLEKQKQETVKQAKAVEEKATSDKEAEKLANAYVPAAVQAMDSFISAVTKYSYGESVSALAQKRPKLSDLMRSKFKEETVFSGKPVVKYLGYSFKEHPGIFYILHNKEGGQVLKFTEQLAESKDEQEINMTFELYKATFISRMEGYLTPDERLVQKKWVGAETTDYQGQVIMEFMINYKRAYRKVMLTKASEYRNGGLYYLVNLVVHYINAPDLI